MTASAHVWLIKTGPPSQVPLISNLVEYLGRYELLGEIAAGGMAKVYLGRVVGEGGFEREVAVKVMHEHLAGDPEFVGMFLDEARLAARIRHPNVVPTVDVQKTEQAMFLVMDFIEGLSLAGLLKQLKKRGEMLPLDIAVRVLMDTLQGLHAAHELTDRDGKTLNLVHRDVSPANVLVGTDGVSRITDFGVARAEARLTSTRGGQVKGKLQYMPPEQIIADEVDRRADVYSTGVVLWEVLSGKRLFDAQHEGALLQQVLNGATVSPGQLNPGVPPAIDEICMRALSVDANGRFASAAVMAEELEEAARAAGVKIATVQRTATFVRGFETNASRIAEARKAAPGLREDLLLAGLKESPSSRAGSISASIVDQVASLPPEPPSTIGPAAYTRTAAVLPTGNTGVYDLAPGPPRRTMAIGIGVGVAISAIVVIAFVGGKLASKDPPGGAGGPTTTVVVQAPTGGPATVVATSPTTAPAGSTSAAAPETTSSADASGKAATGPGGPGIHRPVGSGTAKPKGTESSAADFLPGTL